MERKTLGNSVGVPNGFTTNIIQKMSFSKEQCDICFELEHDGQIFDSVRCVKIASMGLLRF
jgi:hypothetical protein